jgi:hypothetical protein
MLNSAALCGLEILAADHELKLDAAVITVVKSPYHHLSQAEIGGGILRSEQLSGIGFFFGVKFVPRYGHHSPVAPLVDSG